MTNIHEVDLTIRDIENDPESHQQGWWAARNLNAKGNVCNTGMCAAGFTVVRHGYTLLFDHALAMACVDGGTFLTTTTCQLPGGPIVSIAEKAMEILELSYEDSDIFFGATNTLHDLRRMRDELAAGESLDW